MLSRVRVLLAAAFCCGAVLAGCAKPAPQPSSTAAPAFDPAAFDAQRAYAELESFLAVGSRDSGTPGAAAAARHLYARLREIGVEARVDEFEDPSPRGAATVFRNVVGRLPGRGEGLIILGSHYDTKAGMPEGFQGANDSGSSTAALLELAAVMSKAPQIGPEIWFAFFDGEECMVRYGPHDGFHGSRRMAHQLVEDGRDGEVRGVIVLDMIGDRDLTVTIPRNGTQSLINAVLEAAREEGAREKFLLNPFGIADDHEPFLRAGMPAVDLIDFRFGSAPGKNDYWHTAEDTIDKVSAESLGIVGRVTIRVVNRLVAENP